MQGVFSVARANPGHLVRGFSDLRAHFPGKAGKSLRLLGWLVRGNQESLTLRHRIDSGYSSSLNSMSAARKTAAGSVLRTSSGVAPSSKALQLINHSTSPQPVVRP